MAKTSGRKLREIRIAREIAQIELAHRAGISRQALSAIERGDYAPGVGVALRLAAELGATVESLFGAPSDPAIVADYAASGPTPVSNARVALARIGGRLVAVPVPATCITLTPAAGMLARALRGRRVEVAAFRSRGAIDATLIIAGCDPGVAILRDYLARQSPAIEVAAIPGSSHDALLAAHDGAAHAAGVHLRDPRTGGYNETAARAIFATKPFRLVNFARWELGLATRTGGPAIKTIADLVRPGVRLVNRARGSGARVALDEALVAAGLKGRAIAGYDRSAPGHLEVAAAIAAGTADAGVTIRLAADLHGLDFQPWREERYDLVIPEAEFDAPPVRRLMDALNSGMLARSIGRLCAYDTAQMGRVAPLLA